MIESAEEFVRLRSSGSDADLQRALKEELSEAVSRDVLERFPDMRLGVAANETTPVVVLRILSKDDDMKVRRLVARHALVDQDLLEQLSNDRHDAVRLMVTQNPSAGTDILKRMSTNDPWEGVRTMASKRLAALEAS